MSFFVRRPAAVARTRDRSSALDSGVKSVANVALWNARRSCSAGKLPRSRKWDAVPCPRIVPTQDATTADKACCALQRQNDCVAALPRYVLAHLILEPLGASSASAHTACTARRRCHRHAPAMSANPPRPNRFSMMGRPALRWWDPWLIAIWGPGCKECESEPSTGLLTSLG